MPNIIMTSLEDVKKNARKLIENVELLESDNKNAMKRDETTIERKYV